MTDASLSPAHRRHSAAWWLIGALLPAALFFAYAMACMDNLSPHVDEVSWFLAFAKMSWGELLPQTYHNAGTAAPLWYLISKVLVELFGDRVESLRVAAALCTSGMIVGVFALVRRLAPVHVAALAAWLVTAAPLHLVLGVIGRWPPLFALQIVVHLLALHHLVQAKRMNAPWLIIFVVVGALMCYTSFFALVVFAAELVWLYVRPGGPALPGWLQVPWVVVIACFAPWAPSYQATYQRCLTDPAAPEAWSGILLRIGYPLLFGFHVNPWDWWLVVPIAAGFSLLALLAVRQLLQRQCIAVVLLVVVLAGTLARVVVAYRLLIYSPLVCAVLALTFDQTNRWLRRLSVAGLGLLLIGWLGADINALRGRNVVFSDELALAVPGEELLARAAEYARPGDAILFDHHALRYYAERRPPRNDIQYVFLRKHYAQQLRDLDPAAGVVCVRIYGGAHPYERQPKWNCIDELLSAGRRSEWMRCFSEDPHVQQKRRWFPATQWPPNHYYIERWSPVTTAQP